MKHERLLFSGALTSRKATTENGFTTAQNDSALKNYLFLSKKNGQDIPKAVPRPGFQVDEEIITSGSEEGRGYFYWEYDGGTKEVSVIGSTVYVGTTAVQGLLTTSSGRVWFDTTLSNGGLLVFHDTADLYTLDTSDVLTCVSAPQWLANTGYVIGNFVYNNSGNVYVCDTDGTSAGSGGPTGTGADEVDNTTRWDFVATVDTTAGPNFPVATMLPGIVVLDQYVFVADADGSIYNSNVQDAYAWTSTDFIVAETVSDNLAGIARHHNYILGIGKLGVDIFYDAANVNGSPLLRLQGSYNLIGCANGNTIANCGDKVCWLSNTHDGSSTIAIMSDLSVVTSQSSFLSQVLSEGITETRADGYYLRAYGKDLYVLTARDSDTAQDLDGITIALDINEDSAFLMAFNGDSDLEYEYMPFRNFQGQSDSGVSKCIAIWDTRDGGAGSGIATYTVKPWGRDIIKNSAGSGTLETTFYGEIQAPEWDAGNTMNKFIHRAELVANSDSSTDGVQLQWQDEDERSGGTPTYSTARDVDMTNGVKFLTRLGVCKRRKFKCLIGTGQTPGTEEWLEALEGIDIYYTQGMGGLI